MFPFFVAFLLLIQSASLLYDRIILLFQFSSCTAILITYVVRQLLGALGGKRSQFIRQGLLSNCFVIKDLKSSHLEYQLLNIAI